jgi:hypothetical protein
VKWVGSGAFKFRELIRQAAEAAGIEFRDSGAVGEEIEGAWTLAPAAEALAETVALLASAGVAVGDVVDAGALGAIYVRPSDAELKGQWHARG